MHASGTGDRNQRCDIKFHPLLTLKFQWNQKYKCNITSPLYNDSMYATYSHIMINYTHLTGNIKPHFYTLFRYFIWWLSWCLNARIMSMYIDFWGQKFMPERGGRYSKLYDIVWYCMILLNYWFAQCINVCTIIYKSDHHENNCT